MKKTLMDAIRSNLTPDEQKVFMLYFDPENKNDKEMTKEERKNPSILNASRRKRIASGSGQSVNKINNLIKKYEEARKMMKQFTNAPKFKKNKMFRGF
jgi:signal recognition particle subunit SRP54